MPASSSTPCSATTTIRASATIRRSTWAASATTRSSPTRGSLSHARPPTCGFFALDSTRLDAAQRALAARTAVEIRLRDGRSVSCTTRSTRRAATGCNARLIRWQLEPMFVDHGVDVVFSGHEHIYQRSRLQQGVLYFVSGGAGSLRRGDARPASSSRRSFDTDFHFMLIEIDGDALYFQAITRTGETADAGVRKLTSLLERRTRRPFGDLAPLRLKASTQSSDRCVVMVEPRAMEKRRELAIDSHRHPSAKKLPSRLADAHRRNVAPRCGSVPSDKALGARAPDRRLAPPVEIHLTGPKVAPASWISAKGRGTAPPASRAPDRQTSR